MERIDSFRLNCYNNKNTHLMPAVYAPGIVKCKVLVCAVLRSGTAAVPRCDSILQEGDRFFVTAPTENLTVMLKNLNIIFLPAGRLEIFPILVLFSRSTWLHR